MSYSQLDDILKKIDEKNNSKRFFKILLTALISVVLLILSNLLFPTATSILFNIIWAVLLAVVLVFIFVGVMIIIGLRKEASSLLDILLEGSLTLVDFIDFFKELYKRFLITLKEFIIYSAPFYGYIINLFIYIALIFLYKYIGKDYDVTALTFILTISLITIVSILNKNQKSNSNSGEIPWVMVFKQKFREGFSDGIEVMVFIFFITMDVEKLFFLPESLHIHLKATLGDFDLMTRGFVFDSHFRTTLTLIIIATTVEIFRNVLRIIAAALIYYRTDTVDNLETLNFSARVKKSIRKSFIEIKDELVIFVTYTTFLLFVFILFPRLKLLTLAIASVTSLVLDIIMPSRLKPEPKNDLIARTLIKVLRLEKKST